MLIHQDMSLFWETLLPAMEDSVAPNDPRAVAKVRDKTSKLRLKPIAGETESPISKEMAKKEKTLPSNLAHSTIS